MPDTTSAEPAGGHAGLSPEMRLLLVAATGRGGDAERAWAAWLDAVDLDDLERGATPLLGLVCHHLAELGADASTAGRVRGVHRQTWARNRLLWSTAAPFVDRLGMATGPPLVLPGVALLAVYDGDWGARPFQRIQVAAPTSAAEVARDALADTGWQVEHLTPSLRARTRAGLVERWQSQDASGTWITVRWHVLDGISSSVADEQLRGAAATASIDGSKVHVLHPVDALIERLWHGVAEPTPLWIVDAVRLARALVDDTSGDPAALARLTDRAHALGIQPTLRARLDLVADAVPDPAVVAARDAVSDVRPGAVAALWGLPAPATRLGRAWAGHAAGRGVVGGAGALARAQWAARRLRYRGSAHRR